MTEDIDERDKQLVGTEKLIKKIIKRYKDLGYTKDKAFECISEVVKKMRNANYLYENGNKIEIPYNKEKENIDLMLSINKPQ